MAKITASEAIAILQRRKMLSYKLDGKSVNAILLTEDEQQRLSALIEQQAAEIAKKDSLICKLKTCRTCNFVMADRCDKHDRLIDNPMREKCDDWQWLEKEAQGVE